MLPIEKTWFGLDRATGQLRMTLCVTADHLMNCLLKNQYLYEQRFASVIEFKILSCWTNRNDF